MIKIANFRIYPPSFHQPFALLESKGHTTEYNPDNKTKTYRNKLI
jgi:hypothetical protein